MEEDKDIAAIDAEIAKLMAQKAAKAAMKEKDRLAREQEEAHVLVQATPKKKEQKQSDSLFQAPSQPKFVSASSLLPHERKPAQELPPLPIVPSTMAAKMAALKQRPNYVKSSRQTSASFSASVSNSSHLSSKPSSCRPDKLNCERSRSSSLEVEDKKPVIRRDEEDSTLIEELELGPKQFGPDPEGEDEWLGVEPNSNIRLKKRVMPHADLQEFLTGRYYLPPSKLYSVVRLSRDGTSYDVPADDEWVTIAVVAQRGPIKISGMKEKRVGSDREDNNDNDNDDDNDDSEDEADYSDSDDQDGEGSGDIKDLIGEKGRSFEKPKITKKKKVKESSSKDDWKKHREPRKYINFTLCAMPHRSRNASAPSGDALLHLLLFEADHVVRIEHGNGEVTKSYRGGSGGAYEKWCNLPEGSVIAILNPRIWRNLKGQHAKPHPMEFPLGLNPVSDDSIAVIGQARDLGRCTAVQRDGSRCKSWVDLRQNPICEYHVHAAVRKNKSGRGEFTASTNSFTIINGTRTAKLNNRKGLLPPAGARPAARGPDNGGGGGTYIVGGGVINTGTFGDENIAGRLGRSRAEKKKRRQQKKEAEKEFQVLYERERGIGGGTTGGMYLEALKRKHKKEESLSEGDEDELERKPVFSAEAIKRIGYDPSAKRGQFSKEEDQKRMGTIATLEELSTGCRMERAAKRLKEGKLAGKTLLSERQSTPLLQGTSNPSQPRHIDTLTTAGRNKDNNKVNMDQFNIAKQPHGPKIRLPRPPLNRDGDDDMIDLD
ncbi:hypothetical protein CNAG_06588 [Cryptococcus neoformans var. grubii H99]|uniref:Zinc finger Mcm10/DnaG-type domain-containing protein n=1 Tax=Cryptococcus neoformans (strain H99 / ATCC 208821 / CBS 10515 / FGSC 9487) TaxID=235443 RepID=J9VNP5_CRYN9|nr:hypothetical protein CNAG_06588 [Cryptococcus neoformans var. grubii H99]AFR95873.1 hypothetical protein CNAG_06588 [Cryptococcus neoformans var. grubii H99]AUB25729.1 hypothetical protein CKF44_06588 [Cryptococcus neoformans var. grubii]|eukprot:XP_012050714.1 hypothetical protein CNAG_06588 [Cryptococcus neoformans var. grubii H99]